jgi:hypothetical protein
MLQLKRLPPHMDLQGLQQAQVLGPALQVQVQVQVE